MGFSSYENSIQCSFLLSIRVSRGSYIAGGNKKYYSQFGNILKVLYKVTHTLTIRYNNL